jgi:hypothetical protein
MPLTIDDFPLKAVGPLIYAKTLSSPVLTATDPTVAELAVKFLNERHALQHKFHTEGNQPLAVVFDNTGMLVSRTG